MKVKNARVNQVWKYSKIFQVHGEHKARHKWLKGGIEFVDSIPKTSSGKILHRLSGDREHSKVAKDHRRGKLEIFCLSS